MDTVRIEAGVLRGTIGQLLDKYACEQEVSKCIIDMLVESELSGVKTHGIRLLPIYLKRIRDGSINKSPKICFSKKFPAIGCLDGDDGPGAFVGTKACEHAINLATEFGIGAVSVRNSSHFGPAGYYCRLGSTKGFITIVTTNGSPTVAPTGSKQPFFSATPIAIGTPTSEEDSIILDIALSVSSRARIRSFAQQGRAIPLSWALDAKGNQTDDALSALNGSLLPIGGYKGYGLLLMMEILIAILGGASIGPDVSDLYEDVSKPQKLGHMVIAIRIDACVEQSFYFETLNRLITTIKNCNPINEGEVIRVPGENANQLRKEQLEKGIELTKEAIDGINNELRNVGLYQLQIGLK
ncbi:MAG: Ldh family oxidoreductase [Sphaerochaeta sp.]